MSNSRIAFICPSKSWGGLEMNVLRLSIWLNKRGRNILLYCSTDSELYMQASKNGVDIRVLNTETKIQDILQSIKLANSFKKENVRIVLFHINRNFPMMALTKIISRNYFKLLFMQHMHLGGNKKDLLHDFIYKQLDCWIAPLKMFAKRLIEITTISETKIKVIPFGIELEKFVQCSLSKSESRECLELPADKTIVGFVGRIDPKKCQHLLIEATYKLKQKKIEVHVLLVGDSTRNEELAYKQELEKLIKKYSLQEQIHFRSHLHNVEISFKALDIFCLTTGSETFGMVTIEAMASQLAVVGSNEGGTTEIIQHEINGLLYKSGDSTEIVQCIERLIQDIQFKKKLANQAKADALKNYSHCSQCDALELCFDQYM